jgi:hypothetical protein
VLGGLGAAPTQWSADARVKALQTALTAQMKAVGCTTTLKSDGLIGPATCGALAWSKATGAPPAAYASAAADFDAGCKPLKAKAPVCPAPTAAVVPTATPGIAPTPGAAPPPAADTAEADTAEPGTAPAPGAPATLAVPGTAASAKASAAGASRTWMVIGGVLVAGVVAAIVLRKKKG